MRIADWLASCLPSSATWLTVSLGATSPVAAQAPSAQAAGSPVVSSTTVMGQVVDTAGAAIVEADVVLLTPDSTVVARTKTDGKGDFILHRVPLGGPYEIMARRIGYWPARGKDIRFENSDTVHFRFELPSADTSGPPIKKKKNK